MPRIISLHFKTLPSCYRRRGGLSYLLNWAYRFSPRIALDRAPSGLDKKDPRFCGLNIDISGCAKLFHGEELLAKKIINELSSMEIQGALCIAPTLGSAWALSRYKNLKTQIIENTNLAQSLEPLPLEALRLDKKSINDLRELNICRIEHLLAIPTSALKLRFSQEVVFKLHQAIGSIQEPLPCVVFTPSISVTRSFLGAGGNSLQSQEALMFHAKELLVEIVSQCHSAHQSISELSIRLSFPKLPALSKNLTTTIPTDDLEHLWNLLKQLVENCPIDPGIEELTLSCTSKETVKAMHTSFVPRSFERGEEAEHHSKDISKLLDSLQQHLGEHRVCSVALHESHIPENSFSYQSTQHLEQKTSSQLVHTGRPSLLFTPPRALQAMAALPDSPPAWLRLNGTIHRVKSGIGPERITPEWWGPDDKLYNTRDYFRLQLEDGLWIWVFRNIPTQSWFLHGIWS